jgi:uncharacterized protein (DUF1684 family)
MDRRRPAIALTTLILSLLMAAPAGAAEPNYPDPDSLLVNGTFNSATQLRGWTSTGTIRTERFGTRSFPSVAYGRKYRGGARYLSCWGGSGGTVTQEVPIPRNRVGREWRAKFQVSQGGVRGHRVFVRAQAFDGNGTVLKEEHQTKVLDITNHYKKSFAGVGLWPGTVKVRVTLRLMPKKGSASCKVVADTANLTIERA